nr:hypothetical protein HYD84_04170 [Mycoplasmopsis bovis]
MQELTQDKVEQAQTTRCRKLTQDKAQVQTKGQEQHKVQNTNKFLSVI